MTTPEEIMRANFDTQLVAAGRLIRERVEFNLTFCCGSTAQTFLESLTTDQEGVRAMRALGIEIVLGYLHWALLRISAPITPDS